MDSLLHLLCRYEELLSEEQVTSQDIAAFEKRLEAWSRSNDRDTLPAPGTGSRPMLVGSTENTPAAVVAFEVVGRDYKHHCIGSRSCIVYESTSCRRLTWQLRMPFCSRMCILSTEHSSCSVCRTVEFKFCANIASLKFVGSSGRRVS